ncbi:MAG: hypothetical protein AAF680_07145 [Pseudomonadota bacterium]
MMRLFLRFLPLLTVCVLSACSDSRSLSVPDPAPLPTPAPAPEPEPVFSVDPSTIDVSDAATCDITDPALCLFPFPNDFFTRTDDSTPTGLRIDFSPQSIPRNVDDDEFDVSEHNRNDGFSVGQTILTHVPGLDLLLSKAPTLVNMERSLDADSSIQLLHADSGERQLVWAELDASVEEGEPSALMIHVGESLQPGARYVVLLQNLLAGDGEPIEPTDVFKVYQEAIPSEVPELEARRESFESIFDVLEENGITREEVTLAWEFTTASTKNTTERVLHIRDDAFASLAGAAPEFTATIIENDADAVAAGFARTVEGMIIVPNYLNREDGAPGSSFNYLDDSLDALPSRFNGTGSVSVPYTCSIPQAAIDDAGDGETDTRAVVAGHGLFGNRSIATGFAPFGQQTNLVFCSVDWWGMSDQDIPVAFTVLQNLSLFPQLVDRIQQGFLNFMFLSEAIAHEDGFLTDPAFQDDSGNPLFRAGEVHFDGESQGAIMGGALTAVSPHFERSVLSLAGMQWSLIIRRGDAWQQFSLAYNPAYPDSLVRPLGLSLVQMLWDRGEGNGYANYITRNPLAGTPTTRVLMHTSVGDQTLNETAGELYARTLGLRRHNPTVVDGRHVAETPYFGINPITTYPLEGNALMVWDSGPFPINGHDGTPLQRLDNLPQLAGFNTHSLPLAQSNALDQRAHFWRTGDVINVCGATPCLADGYDGTPGEYVPPAEEEVSP